MPHASSAHLKRTNALITPKALRGELDWIVMKAIEKDRTRRYETANAFAADIGRYMDDEPVQAAAPSAAYEFRKFARRNKTAIGMAAVITLILINPNGRHGGERVAGIAGNGGHRSVP